jgi:regulatory protein
LLGVRWRSREELRTRLAKAGFEPDEVERSLEELERAGLIDDQRFAKEMVRSQANGRLAGDRAIRSALRRTGIAPEHVETALADAPDEAGRARDLAERRARRMGALAPEAAYRRLFGQLVRRGYPPGLARDAAREALAAAGGPADLPVSDP